MSPLHRADQWGKKRKTMDREEGGRSIEGTFVLYESLPRVCATS